MGKVTIPLDTEERIHPCNGYFLVEPMEDHGEIIVVRDPNVTQYRYGIVVEMSGDQIDANAKVEDWEWELGDLIYFLEQTEVDGHMFVHWTDIIAYKRFSYESPDP